MKKIMAAIALSVSAMAFPLPAFSQSNCLRTISEVQPAIGNPIIRLSEVEKYYSAITSNFLILEFAFNPRQDGWDNEKNKLATAADQVLTQCSDDVRVIRFSQDMSGYHLMYGPVNGQNQWFECVLPGNPRQPSPPLQWGQQFCGL